MSSKNKNEQIKEKKKKNKNKKKGIYYVLDKVQELLHKPLHFLLPTLGEEVSILQMRITKLSDLVKVTQ